MGCYINPQGEAKEAFLEREGLKLENPVWTNNKGFLPVCLVSNDAFTAAGICFSKQEMQKFLDPEDDRPKKWYMVEITKLMEVSDLLKFEHKISFKE